MGFPSSKLSTLSAKIFLYPSRDITEWLGGQQNYKKTSWMIRLRVVLSGVDFLYLIRNRQVLARMPQGSVWCTSHLICSNDQEEIMTLSLQMIQNIRTNQYKDQPICSVSRFPFRNSWTGCRMGLTGNILEINSDKCKALPLGEKSSWHQQRLGTVGSLTREQFCRKS